jgi:hypothetical protein
MKTKFGTRESLDLRAVLRKGWCNMMYLEYSADIPHLHLKNCSDTEVLNGS